MPLLENASTAKPCSLAQPGSKTEIDLMSKPGGRGDENGTARNVCCWSEKMPGEPIAVVTGYYGFFHHLPN